MHPELCDPRRSHVAPLTGVAGDDTGFFAVLRQWGRRPAISRAARGRWPRLQCTANHRRHHWESRLLRAQIFTRRAAFCAAAVLLAACASAPEPQSRSFTILSVNDVYRVEGLPSGQGGLARVRTLRAELEETWPDLLFMHGGDLLYPSLPSRVFDGEHMVDVLNHLDGAHPGYDDRMFIVFGNHEFDKRSAEDYPGFIDRMDQSAFRWLGTNIEFADLPDGRSAMPNVIDSTIVTSGGVRVGIFGLTLELGGVAYAKASASTDELRRTAVERSAALRQQGAEFVVALTHLPVDLDVKVLEIPDGPDLLIGGHEHHRIDRTVNGRRLLKADSDAVSAWVTTVTFAADGAVVVDSDLRELQSPSVQPDTFVQNRAQWWLDRHATEYCAEIGRPATCLDEELAVVEQEVYGEEIMVRSEQTNLGDWVTDVMQATATKLAPPPEGVPMVALMNSGGLRLNQNLAPGTSFDRRHLEELIKYSDPLMVLRLAPDDLQDALNHAVSCRESGAWLQVAGLSFEADPAKGVATDVKVADTPLTELDEIHAVTTRFLASPDAPGDQDLFAFRQDQVINTLHYADGRKVELRELIEETMTGPEGLSAMRPPKDDRIRLLTAARSGGPGPLCSKD
ncbi:MAG: bifunctional metallophosphatase/5'-nucleotidase [Pseudomonadota bacterium]